MFKKEVILGNFIKKNKILSYLEFIHNQYKIKYQNLFVYNVDGNDAEYMVTFKIDADKKENINDIKGGTILHYKRGCLFSINALNKYIESKDNNIEDNKEYEVNWDELNNKFICVKNNEISLNTINKIEDKTVFFN